MTRSDGGCAVLGKEPDERWAGVLAYLGPDPILITWGERVSLRATR